MPLLETPPNPAPPSEPRNGSKPEPIKFTTRRFGELQEHELIHLLDSIDDEISRARFRESIYVSIIFCLALAWLAFYGPRVLFHQGILANPHEEVTKLNPDQMKFLDLPKNLVHKPPPKAKAISDQDRTAQTREPKPQPKPVQPPPGRPEPPAPTPQHTAPQPQQQPRQSAPQPVRQQQPPPAPTPQPRVAQSIPDAPHPTSQPNFGSSMSPGESNRAAANSAAHAGEGGNYGAGVPSHNGPQGDVEILSDTLNVDFGPYIKRLLRMLYNSWVPLIPEETRPPLNKEGSTLIRFTIEKDGSLQPHGMHLDASTHDEAIDRAAWGSITGVGQFPPLPKEFVERGGPELTLRVHFIIAHNAPKNDF